MVTETRDRKINTDAKIKDDGVKRLPHERDEEIELDCHHMAFGVSPHAARDVVLEIDRFLKTHA